MIKIDPNQQTDFASILASSIHDMKNSLNFVINSLDELREEIGSQGDKKRMSQLQYETKRINNNLIQLLALYKRDHDDLQAYRIECNIFELLEDCLLQEMPILEASGITAKIRCDKGLYWNIDNDLISGVLSNAINNAIRYSNNQVMIEAQVENQQLHIKVHDNGNGFPDSFLKNTIPTSHGINFDTGSTGLGLYFCSLVAALHSNNGQSGEINLSNDSKLKGGCFSILLP